MQTPTLQMEGDDPLRQWLCDRHANPGHRDSMISSPLGISKLPFSKLWPCLCSQ